MKKNLKFVLLLIFSVLCISIFLACDTEQAEAFADGFDAGSNGYSYIGTASNAAECSTMAANQGLLYWRFNTELGTCYGK